MHNGNQNRYSHHDAAGQRQEKLEPAEGAEVLKHPAEYFIYGQETQNRVNRFTSPRSPEIDPCIAARFIENELGQLSNHRKNRVRKEETVGLVSSSQQHYN